MYIIVKIIYFPGLFQKAISQSGSVLMHWAHQKNSRSFALRLADAMGCLAIHNKSIQSDQHIIECLTEANPKTVTEQAEQIFLVFYYYYICIFLIMNYFP